MNKGIFIAGTDTDVGKTYVSLAIIERLKLDGARVGVMKPISAGCEETVDGLRNQDACLLQQHSNVDLSYDDINPYAFAPPIAPHIAAAETQTEIKLDTLEQHYQIISAASDVVLVEGAGGWKVPIDQTQSMADIAIRFKLPVILVVGMRLGCINHALLSAESIARDGCELLGWVANHVDPHMIYADENVAALQARLNAPLLARLPYQANASPASLAKSFNPLLGRLDTLGSAHR